ncbi:MAG: glycosyltransferase family 2 protein [Drouetiella hepatica Uher 2000/2452]|uniref:Glycosyltransferase family 2 protein n=1 Tax=Drouetiella hepatica Uher 2000/2452 TaxID=904376 RepID=A0A951UM31_9CYAN|nr:glycosyltransferase family 2 protein [Drouetiella hepatica Uher 2000/2452]
MLTQIVLLAIALLLLIPIAVLLVECLAALLPSRRQTVSPISRPRTAILVPAHNEAIGIQPVLAGLMAQLTERDRLVVVADNCTDETAAIARSTGAIVIERQDGDRRGKGYALDYGINYLAADPPDIVTIADADCLVQPGSLAKIADWAMATNRPVQALYLMERPAQPQPKDAVSAFAFRVKNLVRPRGLDRLGFPCLLTGTGMAFPWALLRDVKLASSNIVEDMQLGIDLAIAGTPPLFCGEAQVTGLLPQQNKAATSQRTRWEHGHLQTLLTQVPRLVKLALQQRRLDVLAIALDLSVPPLSLLVMFWLATACLTALVGFVGITWLPALALGGEGILLLTAILVAWAKFGRAELPIQTLLAVPLYVLWKIPLYFAFLVRPQTKWVRTDRDPVDAPKL